MQLTKPHFLLYSEATLDDNADPRWKFVLQAVGSEEHFSAADNECETRASRLELLAVVRGLEALAQPSRVTLLTRSRYVRRGIRRELTQWRERRWRWERFGNVVPIRDHDLWQRVDRALQFHQVECCAWHGEEQAADAAKGRSANRRGRRNLRPQNTAWNVAAMLGDLRRGLFSPLQTLRRQRFTPAA